MIPKILENELKLRVPNITKYYGGINNYVSILEKLYKTDKNKNNYKRLIKHIGEVINYSRDIYVINPNYFRLDLSKGNNNFKINISIPYELYNLDGKLIYTVEGHSGYFGYSILDKYLLTNSKNGDFYYLKFKDINGLNRIKVILINFTTYNSNLETSNPYYRSVENVNTISTLTFYNTSKENINLYKIDTTSSLDISTYNFKQARFSFIIDNNSTKVFSIEEACYIFIDKSGLSIKKQLTYEANDILLILQNNSRGILFYIPYKIDVGLVNSKFKNNLSFTDKLFNDIIVLS